MQEKKKIDGGLDLDNAKRELKPGDYSYAMNIRHGLSAQNQKGTITNTKGNKKISYTLPAGDNREIGFYEDKKESTGIYFIWNSNKEHCILRYFPKTASIQLIRQSPVFNFQKNKRINDIDMFGNMLYWKDVFSHPRKINIEKSVMEGKKLTFNITFGLKGTGVFKSGDRYDLQFTTPSGVVNAFEFAQFTDDAVKDNLSEGSKLFAGMFNAHPVLQQYFIAESCDEYIEVTALAEGITKVDISSPTGAQARVIYQNIYGDSFVEEFIDAGKYPPLCEPKVTYKEDPTRSVNLVQNKVFQFRARIIYDDDEKSTLGFVSIIPIDTSNECGDETTSSKNNYIEIDFTEARLNSKESLCIIKKFELFVREGNLGKWRRIIILEQHQFGIGSNIFKFYNDGSYPAIADVEALLPFSSLPLLAASQEAVDNRLAYAGCKEGYNPHCVDGKLSVEYKESPKPKEYFEITGKIRIFNLFAADSRANENQALNNQDGSNTVFGGLGLSSIVNPAPYQQTVPLSGFTVYLAGTDYYAVSKQIIVTGDGAGYQDSNGVFDCKTKTTLGILGSKPKRKGWEKAIKAGTQIYSTFKIIAPPGRYILRVASHLTTQADLDNGTRQYQRTSTHLAGFIGTNSDSREYEVVITNSNVVVPDMVIYDLTDPTLGSFSTALTGYVIEKDIATPADYFNSKRIELSRIVINATNSLIAFFAFLLPSSSLLVKWAGPDNNGNVTLPTDHNGFFMISCSQIGLLNQTITVSSATTGVTNIGATLSDLAGGTFVPPVNNAGAIVLVRSSLSDAARVPTRTTISGSVKDSKGKGIENVSVVNTRGAFTVTDDSGDFEIIVYPATPGTNRTDKLIFSNGDIDCIITFTTDTYSYNITIDANNYNEDNILEIADIIASVIGQASVAAFKRGSDLVFCIIYFDNVKRQTTASTIDNFRLHINFYTEPKDSTANPLEFYPTGQPIVSWELMNAPPDDPNINHYCWGRTKNNQLSFYLQWMAKEVEFTTRAGVVTNFEVADLIRIDMVNLADFKAEHPTSILGYTFVKGDRLRFKKTPGGAFYTEYLDYEIVKTDGNFVFIEKQFKLKGIAKGVQFEIYSPKAAVADAQQVFWEFGECYEIGTDPGTGKRFHKGPTQDQSPSDPYNIPAKGTFKTGDVYYRLRTFPLTAGHKTDFVDDGSVSDFFGYFEQSIGRPQIEDKDSKQLQRDNVIRLSDKYIPGTAINGLSLFQPLNETETDRQYGAITKIIIADDKVLLAIHEHNILPFYIGRASIRDAKNFKLLALADDILNAAQTLKFNYGCQHPESVVEFNNHVFFLDLFAGKEIRYASNGLFAVSDVGMKTWFAGKCMRIKAINEPLEAVAGYEGLHGQMVLTFGNMNSEPNETIAFTEAFEKNRFETFFSFVPEGYGNIGDIFLSFKNGELWRHEQDDVPRNNFYGIQYTRIIDLIFNALPEQIKIFKNISLYGKLKEEQCPQISTPPNGNYLTGMLSRLLKTKFRDKEGVKYAELMRDLNTPNVTNPILNGRMLRGQYLEVRMENDNTEETVMEEVHLYSIASDKSNKE